MGIHFNPAVPSNGSEINKNIIYINFSTFVVSSSTLNKPIEWHYHLDITKSVVDGKEVTEGNVGCSFPLPANFRLLTQANIATDSQQIVELAGIASDQQAGLVLTVSGYDVPETALGDLGGINKSSSPGSQQNPIDWAGTLKSRYKRLDITDALFENMDKRVFTVSPILVCQTPEQCQAAYRIVKYFHFHANPSLVHDTVTNIMHAIPPKGFAIWASEHWPSSLYTDKYFPVINHSFLAKMTLTSADSGQSLTPYNIIDSKTDAQHPLKIQLDLVFVEIQPAYKNDQDFVRNRSTAPRKPFSTTKTPIP